MRDDDPTSVLTNAALLLESRRYRDSRVSFPDSDGKFQEVTNVVNFGGEFTLDELGGFIYYLADILEDADNWK